MINYQGRANYSALILIVMNALQLSLAALLVAASCAVVAAPHQNYYCPQGYDNTDCQRYNDQRATPRHHSNRHLNYHNGGHRMSYCR